MTTDALKDFLTKELAFSLKQFLQRPVNKEATYQVIAEFVETAYGFKPEFSVQGNAETGSIEISPLNFATLLAFCGKEVPKNCPHTGIEEFEECYVYFDSSDRQGIIYKYPVEHISINLKQ